MPAVRRQRSRATIASQWATIFTVTGSSSRVIELGAVERRRHLAHPPRLVRASRVRRPVCRSSSRTVSPSSTSVLELGELPCALVEQQRLDHEVEVAGEHVGQSVDRGADPVVGDPVLLEVVRADLLAPTAAADLRPPFGREFLVALAAAASSYSRARSTCIARARFWSWLRSSCIVTTTPVGTWVMRTAESVVLTCWPPAPDERYTSMSRSRSSIETSTSSTSGSTATVADEVWTRPWLSVTGTRCTRCGPPSNLKCCQASSPRTTNVTWLIPPSSLGACESVSTFHPCELA